jgi:GT2 family glycosyltransferase
MSRQVTTVVITRNRRGQLIETLARHRGPVFVVDNASSDGTAEAVAERFPAVDVVQLPQNLAAAGRNVGVRRATTPYVAFADDDSWWELDAAERAAELFDRHPSLALLAARVVVEPAGADDPFNRVLAESPVVGTPDVPGSPILGFMACAVMVRRTAFLEVGGFDARLGIGGEEQLVAWDLAARGWELRYDDRLVVHHEPRSSGGVRPGRRAALRRATVLSSVMRRPWPDVGRDVLAGITGGRADRRGLWASRRALSYALRNRRPLPDRILSQLTILER